MIQRVWILLLCATLAIPAAAQQPADSGTTVRGFVRSSVDSSPIWMAQVQLDDAKHRRFVTVTDSLGAFTLTSVSPGPYALTARYILYHPYARDITVAGRDTSLGIIVLQGYCPHDSVTALADIARGEPQLIYNGGLAPLAPTRKDLAFEKRYHVQIVMLGDGEPELDVCLGRNNRVVVRFLDDRYGNQWRRAASQTPFANLLRSGTTPD
ncbi:MAG TPA: carboxypeptidase-like regulatory domain-containing protein [Gemmatimonadales bacterium]